MKKSVLGIILLIVIVAFSVSAWAEENGLPQDIDVIIAQYEPGPHSGVSYYQNTPFTPISITPQRFQKEIAAIQSPEEAISYLQGIGLPMDALGCEYIFYYKNRIDLDQFPFIDDTGNQHVISIVRYSYDKEGHDNFAFIFHETQQSVSLIDCISSFGDIQLMQDPRKKNVWLVGKTGYWDYQTVRWYHLDRQEVVLAYLAHGVETDPVDYHVHVTNTEVPDNSFQDTGLLILTKQISVDDFTRSPISADFVNVVVSTETVIYEAQENGDMLAK